MYYFVELISSEGLSSNRLLAEGQLPPVENLTVKKVIITNKYDSSGVTFDVLTGDGSGSYASIFEDPEDRPVIPNGERQVILDNLSIPVNALDAIQVKTSGFVQIGGSARITAIIVLYDGSLGVFDEVDFTSEALSNGQEVEAEVELGKSYILFQLQADRASRVRIYSSEAFRAADASREIGVEIEGEHGLIQETVFTPGYLLDNSMPKPIGVTAEDPRSSLAFLLIENLSGATSPVNIIFNKFSLEA